MAHRISLLGSGLIGRFYAEALQGPRNPPCLELVYSRTAERAATLARDANIPRSTSDLEEAIHDPATDIVIVALPNHLHETAVIMAAQAGKAVLCTKPLGRNAAEARRMLRAVEAAGVFHGYLEDLCYTPKTMKALQSVRAGAVGQVLWVRSRETHGGPHSEWFWDPELAGGGAIIDLACHCVEIGRSFIGKHVRPLEVMCWGATQVHPIPAEDHAVGLVRYENNALGQFEVSWTFRGGMDLRDEVAGTKGTIWLNHWLRTGFELFTAVGQQDYVAEKAEGDTGWLFPVGDEHVALGYVDMFDDMFSSLDQGKPPKETFYDGYVVNAIIDAAYASMHSRRWEPVQLEDWRGSTTAADSTAVRHDQASYEVLKRERLPDGTFRVIVRDHATGKVVHQRV